MLSVVLYSTSSLGVHAVLSAPFALQNTWQLPYFLINICSCVRSRKYIHSSLKWVRGSSEPALWSIEKGGGLCGYLNRTQTEISLRMLRETWATVWANMSVFGHFYFIIENINFYIMNRWVADHFMRFRV